MVSRVRRRVRRARRSAVAAVGSEVVVLGCLFEVVDPQPFSVLSPPVMGRRDREEGFLGRDPEALTSRRDRGRSRSTARLPSTQRVQTDRGAMDTRTSQQTIETRPAAGMLVRLLARTRVAMTGAMVLGVAVNVLLRRIDFGLSVSR